MNLLPWPDSYLASSRLAATGELVGRCLAAKRAARLPSTLMIVGDPGLGREAAAVEIAAALICGSGTTSCGCGACSRVRRGIHPDLQVIDVEPGSTEIRIKQSQALVESLEQVPFEGHRRVVIVADCHTPPLNVEAASALLKALEEPPPHLTFLLLAANPLRVLPTIVSRSVQLRLRRPELSEAAELLAAHHGCDPDVIAELLQQRGVDPALVLRAEPDELAAAVAAVARWTPSALAGDGLAVTSLGSLARQSHVGVQLLLGLLLDLAAEAGAEGGERPLDTAAALVRSEQRRAVLKLDVEAVVTGTLAAARR